LKAKLVRLEGSSIRFFDKLAKADLLILDDFGLTHLDKQQEMDFMEMIEDRHGKCSTIIVSQLTVASWYDVFTEETIADYHNFFIMLSVYLKHTVNQQGKSYKSLICSHNISFLALRKISENLNKKILCKTILSTMKFPPGPVIF